MIWSLSVLFLSEDRAISPTAIANHTMSPGDKHTAQSVFSHQDTRLRKATLRKWVWYGYDMALMAGEEKMGVGIWGVRCFYGWKLNCCRLVSCVCVCVFFLHSQSVYRALTLKLPFVLKRNKIEKEKTHTHTHTHKRANTHNIVLSSSTGSNKNTHISLPNAELNRRW